MQLIFSNGIESPIITDSVKLPYIRPGDLSEVRLVKEIGGIKIMHHEGQIHKMVFYDQSRRAFFARIEPAD